MAKFKNDKGLTLIELLITISVLAVVSAIALPVVNNVVAASNSNALQQTIKDAQSFIEKYSKSGVVAYDGLTKTFKGYVDTDGDNIIDSNELIDSLALDAKFSATANGTSPSVGGSFSNGGITGATVTLASGGSAPSSASLVFSSLSGWWNGTNETLSLSSYDAAANVAVLTQPKSAHSMCLWDVYVYDASGTYVGSGSNGYTNPTKLTVADDGTTCTYTIYLDAIANDKGLPTIDPATHFIALTAGSWSPNKAFSIQ